MKSHTFFTKSVSILMKFKEYDQNTYSNSYKKLMILRESNPIEQNRCENDRNSWNPMKMLNPTHFFSQKVCRINEIQWFPTPREVEWSVWIGFSWTGLFVHSTTEWELTKLNWTGLDWSEVKWSEVKWTELKRKRNEQNWPLITTEPNRTEIKMKWTEQNWNEQWNELNWTETKDGLNRTEHWLQLNCIGLNRTELKWSELNWTETEDGMNRTDHSPQLNWTELDRTELNWTELKWNEVERCGVKWSEVPKKKKKFPSRSVTLALPSSSVTLEVAALSSKPQLRPSCLPHHTKSS